MKYYTKKLLIGGALVVSLNSHAGNLETIEIAENTYAIVGPLEQRSEENLGNNATFGFVITTDGVILIDSGGTKKGAEAIEAEIKNKTEQPIALVINTGGQDHRWFGNSYFESNSAKTITSADTAKYQANGLNAQLNNMKRLTGSSWSGTDPKPATTTIEETSNYTLGNTEFQIIPTGIAHTGGENIVWFPETKVAFSGDIVYNDRMLGISGNSKHLDWIESYKMLQDLEPKIVVPGHGHPSDLSKTKKDTYDYLVFLRKEVGELIDNDGGMEDISSIDQSRFSYLKVYEDLHGKNAQRVFEEMEWE